MATYKVEICGVTTSKLPILKEEEKNILFEKIKKGDNAARAYSISAAGISQSLEISSSVGSCISFLERASLDFIAWYAVSLNERGIR